MAAVRRTKRRKLVPKWNFRVACANATSSFASSATVSAAKVSVPRFLPIFWLWCFYGCRRRHCCCRHFVVGSQRMALLLLQFAVPHAVATLAAAVLLLPPRAELLSLPFLTSPGNSVQWQLCFAAAGIPGSWQTCGHVPACAAGIEWARSSRV